jgi:hypothetical protein
MMNYWEPFGNIKEMKQKKGRVMDFSQFGVSMGKGITLN